MVGQLNCAVFGVLRQVDAVELLKGTIKLSMLKSVKTRVPRYSFTYLVILDGFSQRFHLHSLIQLIFVQQVDEIIQRALVEAHLRVEGTHALKDVHPAAIQSPVNREAFVIRLASEVIQPLRLF